MISKPLLCFTETSGSGYDILNALIRAKRKREDNEEISVLDVGVKPQRIIPGRNPRSQVGTENQIHIVTPIGFEQGSRRWEAKQDTTSPT